MTINQPTSPMLKILPLVLFGVLFFSFTTFAQGEWTTYYTDKQVTIQYKYNDCHRPEDGIHKQEVHLKFSNLTNETIAVKYQKQASYNNKPAVSNGNENTYTVTLKPGEVLEGNCGLKDKRLYIFAKMLDGTSQSVLTDFKLANIQITQP